MTRAQTMISEVEGHSAVFWDPSSPPQRESFEAVAQIGGVLCDLFVSIYGRAVAVTYANACEHGPHTFAFSTYYINDFPTAHCLRDFFGLLAHIDKKLPGTGLSVLPDSAVLCASRLSDYVNLTTAFLARVRPPEGRYFCLRAFPDDLERLVLATDRARYALKAEDPLYSFRLH